ncbi:hypothetical protein HY251_06370 [bacterium]|nr:hypothetical protein [bacterium]
MRHAAPTIGVALAAAFLLGCRSTRIEVPETDYTEMSSLHYEYEVVFDCLSASILEEGFQVARADRDSGDLETNAVPGLEDHVRGTQEGRRIRARVEKNGPKDIKVRFAATRLEREYSPTTPGEWRYVGSDAGLVEKIKQRFDKNVEKRYKPAERG